MARNGYIKIARKFFESPEWTKRREFSQAEAWIDLIQMAAWHTTVQNGEPVERGEVCVAIRFLVQRWGWSHGRVERQIMRWKRAPNVKISVLRQVRSGTVYRILNYDTYQDTPGSSGTEDGTELVRKWYASGTKTNEVKEVNTTTTCASHDEKPPKRSKKKQTWMSPYWDAWVEKFGGKPSAGPLAKALKPLHDEHGEDEVLRRWTHYLNVTDAQYASPARFASTFDAWKDDPDAVMGYDDSDFFVAPKGFKLWSPKGAE